MSETPAPAPVTTYADAERALLARWPETRLEPSLDRIEAFVELLGEPQRGYPVLQLTGTNGKTSTSRMIDALITATGLRTGRFTSPHVESMTERISLDGEPLTEEQFLRPTRTSRRSRTSPTGTPSTRCRSSRRSSGWRTPRSRTPRSTRPSSRSAWAARGTPPASPTRRSR